MRYNIKQAYQKIRWPRVGVEKTSGAPFIQFGDGDMWHSLISGRIEDSKYIDPLPPGSTVTLTQE